MIVFLLGLLVINACTSKIEAESQAEQVSQDTLAIVDEKPSKPSFTIDNVKLEKELLYDQHTLEDVYPYKDTTRMFQWDKIKERLFFTDSIQLEKASWAILQNYKNRNKEAPLIKVYHRNEYGLVADSFGVARYQSIPLFALSDSVTAERYARDGSLVKYLGEEGSFVKVVTIVDGNEWLIPNRYVKQIGDTVSFRKVIAVDVTNQNIATLEKVNSTWYIRSMNPATTGLHKPPHQQETPLGLFVAQEKKPKMIYLVDGTTETGGFAPHATRFCNGGYIHGVPVNAPRTSLIEFSASLGTTPRSHMCVRNATSHAKFIYDWVDIQQSLIYVIN